MDHAVPLHAEIAQQRRTRRTEPKGRILHHRLAAAHGLEEVVEVVVAVGVPGRCRESLGVFGRRPGRMLYRVLGAVLVDDLLLHRIRKGRYRVPGFLRRRHTRHGDRVCPSHDLHLTFGAGE